MNEIFDYFRIYVCEEVKGEILSPLSRIGILAQDAVIFQQKLSQGEVLVMDPTKIPKDTFHTAEDKAILLAEEMDFVLLIDNGSPFEYAIARGLKAINTAAFIVFLCSEESLPIQEAKLKLIALRGLMREGIIKQNLERIMLLGGE